VHVFGKLKPALERPGCNAPVQVLAFRLVLALDRPTSTVTLASFIIERFLFSLQRECPCVAAPLL
jgi:hypothetical protein